MSTLPECGGIEETEREKAEKETNDDGWSATGASAAAAEGVNPLFLKRTCLLRVCPGGRDRYGVKKKGGWR